MKPMFFITGTDTGVGKTMLTSLLARYFCERRTRVAALKPVCSGGRGDARLLRDAAGGALALALVNPWHFRTPIAPVLAARREKRAVGLADVLAHIRAVQKDHDVVLIEGAGGLLSPLGEGFDSRDLISALRATPIIVAPNELGVVNQVLLTLEALPKRFRRRARVVLVSPPKADSATGSNAGLLGRLSVGSVYCLPWFGGKFSPGALLRRRRVRQILAQLCA